MDMKVALLGAEDVCAGPGFFAVTNTTDKTDPNKCLAETGRANSSHEQRHEKVDMAWSSAMLMEPII